MSEVKTFYHISSLTLQEINLVLSQLGNRLDQIEGYRGEPIFRSDVTFEESEAKYIDSTGTIIHSFGGI